MFCFVDYRITQEEILNLKALNLTPIKISKYPKLYSAIDGHVDIQMNLIPGVNPELILHPDISTDFLLELEKNNIHYKLAKSHLEEKYPQDIILNALITDEFLLHNLDFTDTTLLNHCSGLKKIHTNQGYTNCSVLKVTNNAFITSDIKISKLLKNYDYDVLLIPPGDIELPPLDYGFIGGTGGLITSSELVFFGDLSFYKYGDLIKDFLHKYKVKPIYLKKGPLTDRGGIFSI